MSPRSLSHVLLLTSLGLAAPAQAADLGPRPEPPAAPRWSGLYAGVSLGGGIGTSRLAPRLSPLQQTTTTTTIAVPGGCQTSTGLYPVVGNVQNAFDVVGPNVVAPDGTALGRFPNAGYGLSPAGVFNLVAAGPRTTEVVPVSPNGIGPATNQTVAVQNLVPASGTTPSAVARNLNQLDPATNEFVRVSDCRPVLAATDYLTGQVYDRTPNDTPVGTIQAAGTRTETSTATALVGPLANAQGVDAATLAALAALPGQRRSLRTSGIAGGGQVGYTLQVGNLVAGAEADILGTGLSGRFAAGAFSARTSLDWFGTLRGRLGLAFDRVLVYATGGLAYGQVSLSYGLGGLSIGEHRLQLGWTAGGGVEFALTERVSLRAEYKYLDLGTATYLRPEGYDARLRTQAHVATAGLNYRF